MPVTTHGTPGGSLADAGERYGDSTARRGQYFEERAAAALCAWLESRPDKVDVFHDLTDLNDVAGAGLKPLSLGTTNIDNVVLSGNGWLAIDAKGCGTGTLTVSADGKGVLVTDTGAITPQPWMDRVSSYSAAGILYRLTGGKRGAQVWVIPDQTRVDDAAMSKATFLSRGGTILNLSEVRRGDLDAIFPTPQPPATTVDVQRLLTHIATR